MQLVEFNTVIHSESKRKLKTTKRRGVKKAETFELISMEFLDVRTSSNCEDTSPQGIALRIMLNVSLLFLQPSTQLRFFVSLHREEVVQALVMDFITASLMP